MNETLDHKIRKSTKKILFDSFMGNSPKWYKKLIIFFILVNPLIVLTLGKFISGWLILAEFILTLTLSLKCYPLLPGGVLALEIVFLGLVSPQSVYKEIYHNLEVILLLMFMVAGIYFMKDFLSWVFTKVLFSTKSKIKLSLMFACLGAFLSAWLDALTVTAVMIAVGISFYEIYNDIPFDEKILPLKEGNILSVLDTADNYDNERKILKEDLKNFQGFLRNLLMHGAVGTALVGEPQNLLIGNMVGFNFSTFFIKMAHISIPVIFTGLLTTIFVEKYKLFGYGYQLPERVFNILKKETDSAKANMTKEKNIKLMLQAVCALWLIVGLAFHLAPVGLMGLSVIILLTILTGKNNEQQIGKSFEDAMPFTALIVIFFVIVGMIENTEIFKPIINFALSAKGTEQQYYFFIASGLLSTISDNVFVATIYIQEATKAFQNNIIDREQLESLAIAINAGTNILSVATPNGQAAFLFLLTSNIAGNIRLSYFNMLKMTFPYMITLTLVSLWFLSLDWIK